MKVGVATRWHQKFFDKMLKTWFWWERPCLILWLKVLGADSPLTLYHLRSLQCVKGASQKKVVSGRAAPSVSFHKQAAFYLVRFSDPLPMGLPQEVRRGTCLHPTWIGIKALLSKNCFKKYSSKLALISVVAICVFSRASCFLPACFVLVLKHWLFCCLHITRY